MANRNKIKSARPLLKLEALEQRQLLAGGFTAAQGTEFKDIVHANGNVYDQVLMKTSAISVSNDANQITRVSFLDLQGDIVQAEFSGAGTLAVSLDQATGPAAATNYAQPGVLYMSGLASFSIQGSDSTTNFTLFTVGSGTAHNGQLNPIFDGGLTGGNNTADVARLTIVANPANPNGSNFGGIRAGNAIFSNSSGPTGISAANVHIQDVVVVGDINATGTATPTLIFGANSQFGSVTVSGGGLVSSNGAAINNTGSYVYDISLAAGTKSNGAADAAENTGSQLAFTGSNPFASVSKNFVLTTNSDYGTSFTGTAAADTFTAPYTAANGMTLQGTDSIVGGDGTDTLNVSVGAAGVAQATTSSIETITANFSAGGTISLLSSTGVTTVESGGSTNAAIFSNIGSAATVLKASNTAFGTTFGFTNAALTGSSDSVALTVSNLTAGTVTIQPASGTNGAETIAITSSGSPNTLTLDDNSSTSLTTLTIAGTQDLALTVTPDTVTTINAGSLTGALTHTTTGAAAMTVTGGSGNDDITLGASAVADSVDGGAGDDTITFSANLTVTDTIIGGDGTDTLVFGTSANGTGYSTPSTRTISGFEALTFTSAIAAGLTTASIQAGISTLNLTGGTDAETVVMEAGAMTVVIGAANTGTLTVTDTGTAITDSLTVTKTAAAFSIFGAAAGGLVVNGYETVTINGTSTTSTAQTATVITLTPDDTGTSTLNLTGNSSLTTTGAITATVINASGLTGSTAVLTMGAAAATGLTSITGGPNGDTLVGDASSSIDGGSGNDTITGGSGADTLVGGLGNDSITAGAGNDNINGGAGTDTVVIAGNLTANDTIVGGDGTDTLSIGTAAATLATAANVSEFETLVVTTAGLTTDLSVYAANNTITKLKSGAAGAYTVTGGGATFATLESAQAGDTFTFSRSINTLTDSLTVIGFTAVTTTALTASGEETLTLKSSSSGVATFTDVDDAALKTLLITGTGGVVVTNAMANVTALATITDSHTGTGALTINATNSTSAITFTSGAATGTITLTTGSGADIITAGAGILVATGGSGGDSITGGTLADTIDGGSGNDTISGGDGADSLTGGTGSDSITGGEGIDRIIPGTNNDTINLTETTSAVDTIVFAAAGPVNVDTVTGFTAGTDLVEVTIGAFTGPIAALLMTVDDVDVGATAAGGFTTETVAAGVTTTNTAATDFIFLSDKTYSSFANALNGTGVGSYAITDADIDATEGVLTVWFDVTNLQAVVGIWVNDSTTSANKLTSADSFLEIARIGMTSANYTLANLDALMSSA